MQTSPNAAQQPAGWITWDRPDTLALVVLAAHLLVWSLTGIVFTGELYPDVVEALYWGREWVLNTPKHPPVSAWLIESTAALFGHTDAPLMVLAALMPTLTFLFAWLLVRYESDGWTALAALVPLPFMHFFNILCLKYNADTVLSLFWIATIFFLRRAMLTNGLRQWLLFGIAASLAFLTKYSAIVLFISGLIYMLGAAHTRRMIFTRGPWLAATLALLIAAPNLYIFLWEGNGKIIHLDLYTKNASYTSVFGSIPEFLGVIGLSLLPAVVIHYLAWRKAYPYSPATDILRSQYYDDSGLDRYVRWMVLVPLLVTIAVCLAAKMRVGQGWATPLAIILPISFALHRPQLARWLQDNAMTRRMIRPALVSLLIVCSLQPVFLIAARFTTGIAPFVGYDGARLNTTIERYWDEFGSGKLQYVAAASYGTMDQLVAGSAAFRHKDRPAFGHNGRPPETPWTTPEAFRSSGGIVLAILPRDYTKPVYGACPAQWRRIQYPTLWDWYQTKPIHIAVIPPASAEAQTCPAPTIPDADY